MATRKSGKRAASKSAAKKSRKAPAEKGQTANLNPQCPADCELGPPADKGDPRALAAHDLRREAADDEYAVFHPNNPPAHPCNGDEVLYSGSRFIASFTKGLPHDPATGEVIPDAYCALLRAINSGEPPPFEAVPLGCDSNCPPGCRRPSRKLENPLSGFAFDLEAADSRALVQPPPPAFFSNDEAADILENYWMALARDIPFTAYDDPNPLLDAAVTDLRRFTFYTQPSPFYAVPGGLRRRNIFRGFSAGDLVGPYVSQFLLLDVPYGSQKISARIRTVLPRIDYMTSFREWLDVQNGCDRDQSACDRVPRFIRNGRDLGQYVHVDLTFNAFLNAALILMSGRDPLRRCEARPGLGVAYDEGLPYINPMAPMEEEFPQGPRPRKSATQIGFATFGPTHVTGLLLEVMTRALKAVWYQKWVVHRRLRPEEFGGRAHRERTNPQTYPIANTLFASPIFQPNGDYSVFRHNALQNCNRRMRPEDQGGTYLLPIAFAEGSPIHPSYGAGHATVAGACATVLKAFFPEEHCILNPVVPNRVGTALVAYTGDDRDRIRVGGEINKLASNISLGRNFAGMHWRSDHTESLKLGERVAISLLFDQRKTFREEYYFQFTRFNGQVVRIDKQSTVNNLRTWLSV